MKHILLSISLILATQSYAMTKKTWDSMNDASQMIYLLGVWEGLMIDPQTLEQELYTCYKETGVGWDKIYDLVREQYNSSFWKDSNQTNAPSLPVHDSFICHHGYAETGEMEEIMRKAFFEEMNEHISKVDTEILSWTYYKENNATESPSVDQVLSALDESSQWEKRHHLWEESKRP